MKKFLRILLILMWILLVAGSGLLIGFVETEQYVRPCKKIHISIDYGKADLLVSTQDIDSLIKRTAGNLSGKPLGWVNTAKIENNIRLQPYVEKVRVYENNQDKVIAYTRGEFLFVFNFNPVSSYTDYGIPV